MDDVGDSGPAAFWGRLRHRKVVQWGVAYAAGAWGLLQGVGFTADAFGWAAATKQVALLLAIIGFPIALTLAWYHGDLGAPRVSRTEIAILTLLFLAGGGLFWRYQHTSTPDVLARQLTETSPDDAARSIPTDQSIAVLPFVNMSSDKEQEFFADGISEELLNLLAQIPGLRVIARTSSFSFKGKDLDITEIARRLHVAHVLEGSVRRSGDTLRITAQLIRAENGSHLWSRTFERQMSDVFAIQDQIAAAVVDELKMKLLGASPKSPVTDPGAYTLVLRAREIMRQLGVVAPPRAVELYKQALAIDRTYAPAWDGLADAYYNLTDFGVVPGDRTLPLAREAVNNALTNGPDYAPAYARAALIEGSLAGDLTTAARRVEQGLALDPANLDIIEVAIKIARRLGRTQQSVELAKYVVARDPLSVSGYEQLGTSYFYVGRMDDAIESYRSALKLSPESATQHGQIGETLLLQGQANAALKEFEKEPIENYRLFGFAMANFALGRNGESDAALDELIRKHEQTVPYFIAQLLTYRHESTRAFEWLDKAIKYNDPLLGLIAIDPWLRDLHSDPRWLPLLQRLGKSPEQLAAIAFDVKVPE